MENKTEAIAGFVARAYFLVFPVIAMWIFTTEAHEFIAYESRHGTNFNDGDRSYLIWYLIPMLNYIMLAFVALKVLFTDTGAFFEVLFFWGFGGILFAGMIGGMIGGIIDMSEARRKAEEARRNAEAAEDYRRRAAAQKHRDDQRRYHESMVTLGEQSMVLFESIPKHILSVEECLDQAEVDFAEGAFAPFWDCIENTVNALGRFDKTIRMIEGHSNQYGKLIQEYEGAPPSFPLAPGSLNKLSVAGKSTTRMQAIVRKAQCNYQFATIYEQRKTNRILVEGFTNLAQGLQDMTWRITTSIDDLAQSVNGMTSTLDNSLHTIHSRLGDVAETVSKHADQAAKAASSGVRAGAEGVGDARQYTTRETTIPIECLTTVDGVTRRPLSLGSLNRGDNQQWNDLVASTVKIQHPARNYTVVGTAVRYIAQTASRTANVGTAEKSGFQHSYQCSPSHQIISITLV